LENQREASRLFRMKLWQIVQWNNIAEKINGWDTSILVRAKTFDSAISVGEGWIKKWSEGHRNDKADVVMLLGEDAGRACNQRGDERVVVHRFIQPALNLGKYKTWRKECVLKDGQLTDQYEWVILTKPESSPS